MKSSRRKQTNPNRVSAGVLEPEKLMDLSSVQSKPDAAQGPGNASDQESVAPARDTNSVHSDDSSPPPRGGSNGDYELPLDMHVAIISCPLCPETFSNVHELQEHKLEAHGPELKRSRKEPEDAPDDFPTAYHRLGRELRGSTELALPNGHEKGMGNGSSPLPMYSGSPSPSVRIPIPHLLPRPEASQEEDGTPPIRMPETALSLSKINKENANSSMGESSWSGKPERIFHMDAYCELCDREFCNKYFLKTHKANKHGIYEDNSPPAGSVPLPLHGMMGDPDQNIPFNFKMDGMKPPPSSEEPMLPWSFKLDSTSTPSSVSSHMPKKPEIPSSSGNSYPSKHMGSPLPMFPLPMPNMDSSKSFVPGKSGPQGDQPSISSSTESTVSSTSILNSITNSIKAAPPATDPSMEDYCHICQKHFCNKYYLKKHKQDVHGIAPETPSGTSNKRSRPSLLDSMPITSANPMMMPQPLAGLTSMPNLPGMPGLPNMPNMPNMPPGVMVINPYSLPPVAIIPAGSLMPGQQMPPPPHPIISQPPGMTPLGESPLMISSSTPSSTSTTQSHSPPAKPGGPSQAEAGSGGSSNAGVSSSSNGGGGVLCNVCGKEFCNEFYLQVHKESKHKMMRATDELDSPKDKALSLVKREAGKTSPPPPLSSSNKHEGMHLPPMSQMGGREPGRLVCHICNKEFSDPYLFNAHRLQEHGFNEMVDLNHMESGEVSDRDDAMRNMNQSLARMAADASAVNYATGFGALKAGQSQEIVVCDICNKEIANQYFLRLHKFNVHGIDPISNDRYEGKSLSSPISSMSSHPKTPPSSNTMTMSPPSQQPLNMTPLTPGKHHMLPFLPPKIDFKDMPPFGDFGRDFKSLRDMPPFLADSINNELFARSQNRRHLDLNFFGFPSLGKLPGEDNVKLNFDPEAYCDICKKEFCSKYFLRTHKQNIHGIKCDVPTSSAPPKTNDLDRLTNSLPMRSSTLPSNGKTKENMEKSSWRWKEPVNSSRVICDICNKEVCNKYFLRTHKFKKHGIPPSSQSPSVSVNGSPVASDCDTASNASSQPDEKPRMEVLTSMPQMIPLPPSDKLSEKFPQKNINNMKSHMHLPHNNNNNNEYVETCNVCRRRFKTAKLLKEHIWKHHSINDTMDSRVKSSPPIYPCQVCGIDFPAELSVQLHLIQEHNARVTLDTDEPQIPTEEPSLPNGEISHSNHKLYGRQWGLLKKASHAARSKKYICSHCDFNSVWLSSLLDHELEVHGIASNPTNESYQCTQCHRSEPSPGALSNHLVEVHGWTSQDAHIEARSNRPAFSSKFKCSHCPAVFPSHVKAMYHFRQIHIRAHRDLSLKKSYQQNLLHCPSCSFKTHFFSRLQRHVKCHLRNYPKSKDVRQTPNSERMPERMPSPNSLRLPTVPTVPTVPTTLSANSGKLIVNDEGHGRNNITAGSASYKSIAASLLSSNCPDDRRERRSTTPNDSQSREDILLQTYALPMSPVVVDTPSFKMTTQKSGQSAVIGL